MPRTKRPVRKQEKKVEQDDTSIKLEELVSNLINNTDLRTEMECRDVEVAFKILLETIPSGQLQKTIGQLKTEIDLAEGTRSRNTRHSNRSASHDDGYLTENSSHGSGDKKKKQNMAPPSSSRSASRRSRSVESARRPPATITKTQRRRSRSVYRTPALNKNPALAYPAITPKVAPHTPLTLLRQPRVGEMVVSMSGSPLSVPTYNTMQPAENASCNILLKDGTTLSVQPKQLRQSQVFIPFSLMDTNVLDQLKTLRENLGKVVALGEKAIVK